MIRNLPFLIGILVAATGAASLWQECYVEANWGTKEALTDLVILLAGIVIWLISHVMERDR